jgi:hypothetical protein
MFICCVVLFSSLSNSLTQNVCANCSYETSIAFTRDYIPPDKTVNNQRSENFTVYIYIYIVRVITLGESSWNERMQNGPYREQPVWDVGLL